ncbi:MAG TPA: glycosyltransferase [Pyrinomonadaceae bacterium]|nr:glycosyltransferase [Pyrinomonadaceae bacterium]
MSDGPQRNLAERLPPRSKLLARRLFVGAVGACVRLAARAYRAGERLLALAVAHGLDLDRAWGARPAPRPFEPRPFGARDFLLLADAAAARDTSAAGAAGDTGPLAEPPRASVILPAFGRVEQTFQCLRALLDELDPSDTEIVVVDDASRDETARLLSHLAGAVRVVRNAEPLGFAGACNRGAEVARGRYFVFLGGGGALVMEGWLRALVETAEADDGTGAVGPLVLAPDNLIREAGTIVWRDGSLSAYGRGRPAGERRHGFAREVDCCSAASLLVRRDLFRQLGGFDRLYARADYAAADLCLGVRALGRRVVHQPASRLVSFAPAAGGPAGGAEGVETVGGDGAGPRNREADRARLCEKWRDVLEREHLARDAARIDEAADRRRRDPCVFVFDDIVPRPDRDAGSARMLNILRALARRGRPVFVYRGRRGEERYERLLWFEGVETAQVAEYPRLLRERRPAVAVVSRPEVADLLAGPLRLAAPKMKIVFDMVDAHFVRHGREAELTGDSEAARRAEFYRELEARAARASDMVWCASVEDARAMSALVPNVPRRVVPTIHRPRETCAPFDARRGLLFVGNYSHRPNADAVRYLVGEILPRLGELLPGAADAPAAFLVGDNATDEIKGFDSERVRVLGYVPDLEPLLEGCRVFVAPLRFGAGMKGKILEAFAHGLPVVTTSIGAESMAVTDGEQALVRDDPREFAAAIALLYHDRDLWQKLSRGGRAHVARHFSPEAVGRVILGSLGELIEPAAAQSLDPAEQPPPAPPAA